MIERIQGVVVAAGNGAITLMVHGIGMRIVVPRSEQYQLQNSHMVYTATIWSAEQGPQLFGFMAERERDFFELLVSCPGVGPRLAVTVLAHTTVTACAVAIAQNKIAVLSAIKGIGTKKAEAMSMHLRDKVAPFAYQVEGESAAATEQLFYEAEQTLLALKYSSGEVHRALIAIRQGALADKEYTFDHIVRRALQYLAKGAC